jgi:hypothetical protein
MCSFLVDAAIIIEALVSLMIKGTTTTVAKVMATHRALHMIAAI